MTNQQFTITDLLARLQFDTSSGKIFRMFQGPDDKVPKEYELPLTDPYLLQPFDPTEECFDFFAEDTEHLYFAVPPLPGENVVVCKASKLSRQLVSFDTAKVRHDDEVIQLQFSKNLALEIAEVVDGTVVVFWREARIAAIGDSVESAVSRVSILLVNRLIETSTSPDVAYNLRADVLITKLLRDKGINVAIHCSEAEDLLQEGLASLLEDPSTDSTSAVEYEGQATSGDKETDLRYN